MYFLSNYPEVTNMLFRNKRSNSNARNKTMAVHKHMSDEIIGQFTNSKKVGKGN